MILDVASQIVDLIGSPKKDLQRPWVKWLCALNGVLAFQQYGGQFLEKSRFPTPQGQRKVAAFNVMNAKYVGYLRYTLFAHIASGMISQIGSSLSIVLEKRHERVSRRLAQIASLAESLIHAPTAFILTPFVYGDKGVVPYLYGTVSFLLLLSGLTSVKESFDSNCDERIELRRMCTTISIFLYVRLYAVMRGVGGFLRKQKYSMAVMTAGTAMMPVGWSNGVFPLVFWLLMFLNRKTAGKTLAMIRMHGVDGTASRQAHLA